MTIFEKQRGLVLSTVASICLVTAGATQTVTQQNPVSGQAESQERSCVMVGTVVSGTSGNAVKRAQIHVDHGYLGQPLNVLSDDEGRFTLPAVAQGTHRVVIHKRGFVDSLVDLNSCEQEQETGDKSSSQTGAVSLRIMPLAVISGRVTDDAGVPVVEASVRAQQYRGGRWVGAATASTNDLGMYRLYGLQPGSYYVSAEPDLTSGNAEFVTGESPTDYGRTFYPQARDAASGMAVTLDAGYTATGIDIQLAKMTANNSARFLPVAESSASSNAEKGELANASVSLPSDGLGKQPTTAVANSNAGRGSVEGWVVNELTSEPIRHGKVTLRSTRSGVTAAYSALSDATGHFWMAGIDPGTYLALVDRAGFLHKPHRQGMPRRVPATITLKPKSDVQDLILLMTPSSVVTGRVLDQDGDPAAGFHVQAMRYSYVRGKRQLQLLALSDTNDLGEYRLYGLDRGQYYIAAMTTASVQKELQQSESAPDHYIATYFPNAVDIAGATPISVAEGSQVEGIDISAVVPPLVAIRGRASCSSGPMSRETVVTLASRASDSNGSTISTSGVNAEGNFQFRGVAPGLYTISATFSDQHAQYGTAQALEVRNSSIENLQLVLNKAMVVNGRIESDGDESLDLRNLRILLEPEADLIAGSLVVNVKSDAAFSVSGIFPLDYRLEIFGLPERYYVRKIQMGMEEIPGRKIDFSHFAGSLILQISSAGGSISGSVFDHEQQPVQAIEVALVPDPPRPDIPELYKTVRSDQSGQYTIQGIPPGNYQIFAIDGVESDAYLDPDFLHSIESDAQTVSVLENSRVNLTLRSLSY